MTAAQGVLLALLGAAVAVVVVVLSVHSHNEHLCRQERLAQFGYDNFGGPGPRPDTPHC